MLSTAISLLLYVLWCYFMLSILYLLVFGIASRAYKSLKVPAHPEHFARIAVLIPCYRHDELVLRNARELVNQTYNKSDFEVFVLGDELHADTLQALRESGITVISIHQTQRSKAGSLNLGLAEIKEDFDMAFILDVDNRVDSMALQVLNAYYQKGFQAIQGHRTALNRNSDYAILDGLSEEINNEIFRKGHRVLGFSSALIGSGMAFDFALYKELMRDIHSFGEDKELEFALLKRRVKIAFADEAVIYDEKVGAASAMYQQRRRWIAAQVQSAKTHARDIFAELSKGNWDFVDKYVQMLLPPRVLLFGILTILCGAYFVLSVLLPNSITLPGPAMFEWLLAFGLCFLAFLLATPARFYTRKTLKALSRLPVGFLLMAVGVLRHRKGYRSFNPTEHKS